MLSKEEIVKIETDIDKFVNSLSYLYENESLDGDETMEIADGVLARLNLINGNITEDEYSHNKIGGR